MNTHRALRRFLAQPLELPSQSSRNAALTAERAWARHGLALLHIVTGCHTWSHHVGTAQINIAKLKGATVVMLYNTGSPFSQDSSTQYC